MARIRASPKAWDRFAKWAPGAAILVLGLSVTLLILAALTVKNQLLPSFEEGELTGVTSTQQVGELSRQGATPNRRGAREAAGRDTDLALYDAIAEGVSSGENYYKAAVEQQRARDFPVRPGLAVRLPTLAIISASLGSIGMSLLAVLLIITTILAWWMRLEDEPGGRNYRIYVIGLVLIGCLSGFKPQYLVLHEVWAGVLLALSLALHRPNKWLGAWIVAALALSIRELALPFVLLLGTMALVRGKKVEAGAWALLLLLFGAGLGLHLGQVNALTNMEDAASSSWLALRGLGGWSTNLVLTSVLYWLPGWLAAPLALLPLLGLAGWRSDLGLTAFLLCSGYGLLFMIAGRDNNFYWALMIMPISFIGFAYLPRSLASLWNSARAY